MLKRIITLTLGFALLLSGVALIPTNQVNAETGMTTYNNQAMTVPAFIQNMTVTCGWSVKNQGVGSNINSPYYTSMLTNTGCTYNTGAPANSAYRLLHAIRLTKPGEPDFTSYPQVVTYPSGYIQSIYGNSAQYRGGEINSLVAVCDYAVTYVCSYPYLYQ